MLALLVIRLLNPEPEIQGRALSEWLIQLRDSNPAKREEARLALGTMGPEAIPYLTGALTRPPSPFQKAARAASKYVPDSLKGPLGQIYRPRDELVNKHMALQAIGIMGTNGAGAVPAVGEMLRQSDVGLASAAATALIYLGTNSLPELIAALDDGDYNIRAHACYALAIMQGTAAPAVPRLGQIVLDERGAIASTAAMTLARIGDPAVPLLTEFLKHTNAAVRQWGGIALGQVSSRPTSVVPDLILASRDADAGVRSAAVQAIGTIERSSPETATVLLRALDDPNVDVRMAAAQACAVRPRLVRENEERFYRLLADQAAGVRAATANAIGQAGQFATGAIPGLTRLLDDTNEVVRVSAQRALATITNSFEMVRARRFEQRD
jgi:HEAT repeat protein